MSLPTDITRKLFEYNKADAAAACVNKEFYGYSRIYNNGAKKIGAFYARRAIQQQESYTKKAIIRYHVAKYSVPRDEAYVAWLRRKLLRYFPAREADFTRIFTPAISNPMTAREFKAIFTQLTKDEITTMGF